MSKLFLDTFDGARDRHIVAAGANLFGNPGAGNNGNQPEIHSILKLENKTVQ